MKRAYDGYSHGSYEQCDGLGTIKREPKDYGNTVDGRHIVEEVSNRTYANESFRCANQNTPTGEIYSEIKIENHEIEELPECTRIKKIPKSSTERGREFRLRRKQSQQPIRKHGGRRLGSGRRKGPKTNADRNREYRQRVREKRSRLAEFNRLTDEGSSSQKVQLDDCTFLDYNAQAALGLAHAQTLPESLLPSSSSSAYFPIFSVISEFRAQVMDSLKDISNRLERLETAICGPRFQPPAKFPIKSLDELHEFIGKMKNEEVRKMTLSYFKNMQPRSKEMVVKFMRSHFADDLLIQFNYRGEQGKQSFKNNELFSLLTEVWTNEHFTLDEIQSIFKEELSKCRGRRKQQKMRESRKNQAPNISECL